MIDLAHRLAVSDPEASAALQVVTYFDELLERGAGLHAVLRGVASLGGAAARFSSPGSGLALRADETGIVSGASGEVDPRWVRRSLGPDGAEILLELIAEPTNVQAIILDRAVACVRALGGTRSSGVRSDSADLDILVDPVASALERMNAGRRMGLAAGKMYRAVAKDDGSIAVADAEELNLSRSSQRAGVGHAVPIERLPDSYAAAHRALRLTARGTREDPGPRVIFADDQGALLALADGPVFSACADDVRTLEHASAVAPWALLTLEAVSETPSLRAAATLLNLHHSTLQERLGQVESLLGWSVRHPHGRLRMQIALRLRRAQRNRLL